jgi:hypothetical protein
MSDLLNSASLVLIPSGYKEDIVYSAVPTDGSGDLSFTRASNGTRVNSAGLVEVTPWNIAGYSEEFNNAYWTKAGATITANDTTAPNGAATADKVLANSGNTEHGVYNGAAFASNFVGEVYTYSVYAKKGTVDWLVLDHYQGGYTFTWFNLNTGTLGTVASGVTATIESVGNGWYRCSCTKAITATTLNFIGIYLSNANNTWNFNAAGTETIYIWGAQVNLSTAKPYFPTTDRLNVPRLTYQNGGGGCPSLLLEKQSTNGLYPSEDFSTTWSLYNSATVTTNQATSPDGTQNADKITTTNQATAMYNVNGAGTPAQAYTASLFIKYIDNTEFAIGMTDDVTGEAFARFNFTTGTATTTLQGDWTSISYTWVQQANGWYRISVTATKGASGNARFIGKGGGAYNYFIWGAQVEASSYPTSYIPTTSASATRVADFATTNNISSLFGSTEGSFFIEMTYDNTNASGAIPLFLRSSTNAAYNYATYLQFGGGTVQFYVYDSGSSQVSMTSSAIYTTGQKLKIAFAYKQNDFVIYVNGVQIGTDANGSISTSLAFIDLGTYNQVADTYRYNGAIGEAVLFPIRLTNTQLAQLTA